MNTSTKATHTPEIMPALPLSSYNGIGIFEFLQGKIFFVTGATGFLAKVLIEKILRAVPNVERIFLMIKGKNKDAIQSRLKNEIIDDELFKCLKQIHGDSYEAFMMRKLVPILGDIGEYNLGMDADTADEISKQVHIIVNSAASTSFNERYDVALKINTIGPTQLLNFAKKCKNIQLFMQVSTAYANRERRGKILEKPFCLGQSIAEERMDLELPSVSVPLLDVNAELKLACDTFKLLADDIEGKQIMKDLGTQRARIYGWQNTYSFTKAMGEMLINNKSETLPVVIIRPSIIESTYKEPFPGWIQGNRMLDPLFSFYGKGQLPGFIGDPKTVLDIVPADMVVNAIIAAMAKHGTNAKPQLHVYHVSSSVSNPISYGDLFDFAYDYFTSFPLLNSQGKRVDVEKLKYFGSIDSFSSYIEDELTQKVGLKDMACSMDPKLHLQMQIECSKRVKQLIHRAKFYKPYLSYGERFDNSNTKKLIQDMSTEEEKKIDFHVDSINWKHYIKCVHLPGLVRHVIKEQSTIAARL